MALLKCAECGGPVSSTAKSCPACGAAPKRKTSLLTWVVGGVTLLLVFQCTMRSEERERAKSEASAAEARRVAAMTPEQRKAADEAAAAAAAEKVKKEAEFQYAVRVAQAIKAGMKNPASFELTSLLRTYDGTLCFEYRGTNSFNAVIPNYAVVPVSGAPVGGSSNDVARAWNKHCANKAGDDLTYVRRAL